VPAHADRRGDHAMACRSCPKTERHDAIGRAVGSAAQLAGIGRSFTSVLGCCRRRFPPGHPRAGQIDPSDRSKKRPDVVLYDFDAAQAPTLVDFRVTHPTTLSYSTHAYEGVGAHEAFQERAKVTKYIALARALGFNFMPFGIETYGAWGPGATEVLRRLTRHAEAEYRVDTSESVGWCAPHIAEVARQWVSVALFRGNAQILRRSAAKRWKSKEAQQAAVGILRGDDDEDDDLPLAPGPAVLAMANGAAAAANGQPLDAAAMAANAAAANAMLAADLPPPALVPGGVDAALVGALGALDDALGLSPAGDGNDDDDGGVQQAERDRLAGAGGDGDEAAAADGAGGFSFAAGFAGFGGDGEAGAEGGSAGGEAGGGGGSPAQAVGGGGSPARVVVAGYGGGSPDARDFLLGSSSDEED